MREYYPLGVEKSVLGYRVAEESYSGRDFDPALYDKSTSPELIHTHVEALFGEKLLKPRRETVFVGRDGQLDPDYLEMMQKSVSYWRARGDEKAARRFEQELLGVERAAELIVRSEENGQALPVVINASDPGEVYQTESGDGKSVTFLWMRQETRESGWVYQIYSLPTQRMGLEKHWELLKLMGDIQSTEAILAHSLQRLTADELIAFPVILDELNFSLTELAQKLGYQNFEEIEEIAKNQLALESDTQAAPRRKEIVENFARRIYLAIQDGLSADALDAIVDAMSDTMAIEEGKMDYLGMDAERISREIEKNVRLALAMKKGIFSLAHAGNQGEITWSDHDHRELYAHAMWMRNIFRTNPLAEAARNTGCGSTGISLGSINGANYFDESNFSSSWAVNYSVFDTAQTIGFMEGGLDTSVSSSKGKYTQYYDYYHDVCRGPCGGEKPYVAHAKPGVMVNGEPVRCAGWCSDCEK